MARNRHDRRTLAQVVFTKKSQISFESFLIRKATRRRAQEYEEAIHDGLEAN